MCGITLNRKYNHLNTDKISHRGIEKNEIIKGDVVLCHHRLPIQTLDGDNWTQPREISRDIFLLFNGEIFNYDKSYYSSDIEYLCDAFSSYAGGGLEMFTALYLPQILTWDGFWAIVIYNANSGEIIAFTDPLGKKCLYVNEDGEISSEIKSLVGDNPELDQSYISSIRKWGYNKDDRTPYKSVKRILPNQIYSYNIDSPMFMNIYRDYWQIWNHPIPELVGASYEDHMNWLWDKMAESIKNRLLSRDYPISVLVSGGLDSSIIAAFLKSESDSKLNWFTIENDETEYVDILAKHLNISVKVLDYKMEDARNKGIYKKWNETPVDLGSVIPQFYLFEAVKGQGDQRIVISGDGSDELFGGYSRINEYDSQQSDIFEELSYYHLPRLDKMSMAHTLELRSPFLHLDIVRFAMHLPLEWRKDKKILKDTFSPMLPDEIVNRKKVPLKNPQIKKDKLAYRQKAVELFLES
jgi:asparagine synthase (glutamine-hydrolysing)